MDWAGQNIANIIVTIIAVSIPIGVALAFIKFKKKQKLLLEKKQREARQHFKNL